MNKRKNVRLLFTLLVVVILAMTLVVPSSRVSAQTKHERLIFSTRPARDVWGDRKKSIRQRASELKQESKDRVRRRAEGQARNRNRRAARNEVLHLYFEPESCDELLTQSPLEETPDLLTRTVAYAPFKGMEPPEDNPEVGESLRTFDTRGNLTRHETRSFNRDPGDPPVYLIQCQYDGDNNLIAKTFHYLGRLWEPVYRATYIAPGMPDEETYEFVNRDGIVEWRSTIRNTYDQGGRYVRGVSDWDDNADGTVESRSTEVVSYDSSGFRSRVVVDADDDADGDSDGQYRRFANRGRHDRLESGGDEWDVDLDGIVDLSDTYINFYDDRGTWIRELRDVDIEGRPDGWADGIPDSRTDARFLTYDSRGNLTSSSMDYWFAAPFTTPDIYYEDVWEYDHHNQVTRAVITADREADGDIDERNIFTGSYDRQGQLIESVWQFGGADPAYGNVTRERFTFDRRGNLVEWIITDYLSHRPNDATGYRYRMEYERRR